MPPPDDKLKTLRALIAAGDKANADARTTRYENAGDLAADLKDELLKRVVFEQD
ncbi:MAG: hypothetical protein KJ587_06800 [Alphaproteobacteria bacterium]|nr:hypothetical protein [Alphaproteobacteria bacterium]